MKHKIKVLPFVLLTFLMAVISCGKEDVDYGEAAKQFGPNIEGPAVYLKGARAEEAINLLNTLMKSGVRQKNIAWEVDFSEVLLVTDGNDNNNYTYRVTHPDAKYDEFYNLVLTENITESLYTIKLIRYKMNRDFANRFYSGLADISEYEGTITYTPIRAGGQLLDFGPSTDPDPQPTTPPDPCDGETTIVVGGGVGGGGGGGGSTPFDPNGNGGGIEQDATLSYSARCLEWVRVQCSMNTAGHYGNVEACQADFKGATYLINTCNNTISSLYGRSGDFATLSDPCAPVGNIGILFPRFLHLIVHPNFSENFPCQTNIVVGAYSVCSDLNAIFLGAFENSETHSVTYVNDPTISGNGGTDPFPQITTNPDGTNHYTFTIRLQDDYLSNATDLAIATTVIHENFHAILLYLQYSGFIDPTQQEPTYQDLLYAYIDQLIINGTLPPTNDAHHQFMAQFINDIASTIEAYGVSRGYNLPSSFYTSMAWAGLMDTPAFSALYPPTSPGVYHPQHVLINNTIVSEENNIIQYDAYGNQINPQGTVPAIPCP